MKKAIFYVVIFISGLACTKKDNCKEVLLIVKHFETEYGCMETKHNLSIDLTDSCTIIRSKTDFDSKVSGICHPDIDFSLYDLIIGKKTSSNQNDTIVYDLRKTCPDNQLTLTVEIIQGDLTQPDNITYHALIPKLGDEETLRISITSR
jgi:hypothetical protein